MPLADEPVTLLVVDDEEAIRNALRRFLAQQGYEVATAASGEEALAVLQRQKITGMLLDVNMPGISGVELVPQVMELEPTIALLMLTAVNDATSAALCMQRGAYDYLIKPIDLGHLSRAIHQALQRRHTQMEGLQINQWLKDEVTARVAERRLEQANQERILIEKHTVIGDAILSHVGQFAHLRPAVRNHHERWDGKGYPDHLAGEATPLPARILAVADACDAMLSDRPYRRGMPPERLDVVLRDGAGSQWDPEIIAHFFRCRDDVYAMHQRGVGDSVARAVEQVLSGSGPSANPASMAEYSVTPFRPPEDLF